MRITNSFLCFVRVHWNRYAAAMAYSQMFPRRPRSFAGPYDFFLEQQRQDASFGSVSLEEIAMTPVPKSQSKAADRFHAALQLINGSESCVTLLTTSSAAGSERFCISKAAMRAMQAVLQPKQIEFDCTNLLAAKPASALGGELMIRSRLPGALRFEEPLLPQKQSRRYHEVRRGKP